MLYDKLIKELVKVKRAVKEKFGDDGQNKRGARDYSSGQFGFDRIRYEIGRIAEAIRHTDISPGGGGGGGGITDAPKNGKAYNRKNGNWVEAPKTSEFADPNTVALRDDDGCINVAEGVEEGHAVNYGQMQSAIEEINKTIQDEATGRENADTAEVSARNTAIANAVSAHNGSDTAHSGIRQAIAQESTERADGDTNTLESAKEYTDQQIKDVEEHSGTFINVAFSTKADLDAYTIPDRVGPGDFTFVQKDETHDGATTRYICGIDPNTQEKVFKYSYTLNQNFSDAQMAAINSGITA
jgi:hypothetical protein